MTNLGRVLVTGAGGFIGSHLTEALLSRARAVRALVHYNSFGSWGWLDALDAGARQALDIVKGDIRDPNGVRLAMQGIDTVFHLAALIGIPYSYHSPDAYVDTNVRGTLNVLQAARTLSTPRVVVTSTSEVYGTARFVPMNEDHPLQAQSPYAATKIAADQLALSFQKAFGTPVAVIRPFNTFGPRQSTRAVIPTIISQIARGDRVLRLGSLAPTRDFNFVPDTVSGFIAVAESDLALGRVTNIGSGHETSIRELVDIIAGAMGVTIEIEKEPGRIRPESSEVERLVCDASWALAHLAWKPTCSGQEGLTEAIAHTVDWYSLPSNLNRMRVDAYGI